MNILITGATGFIGSHLVKALIKDAHTCRCLLRDTVKAKKIFENIKNVEYVVGDILSPNSLVGIAGNIDIVFHLAAHGHVAACSEDAYKQFTQVNVTGTENLIRECQKENITKFFHFSSTAAVGLISDKVVDENIMPQPKTPYQRSKLESETLVKNFYTQNNFPVIIFRPCMVYGPQGFGEFFKLTRLVQKGIIPKIGRKKKLTPIIHVNDVIQACLKGLAKAQIGETYFICGTQSYPFDEIIECITESLNSKKPLLYIPEFVAFLGAFILEFAAAIRHKPSLVTRQNIRSTIADRIFSIEKAKRAFDYHPAITLKDGITETIDWYKKGGYLRG